MVNRGSNQDVPCTYPPFLFFTSIKASETTAALLPFMDLGVPLLNSLFFSIYYRHEDVPFTCVPRVLSLERVTYNPGDYDEVLSGLQYI